MSELLTLGRVRLVSPNLPERAATGQPKRLALLAYLAVSLPPGLHRRDTLLALFWPELPEEDGRRALRQALHYLRQVAGESAVVTSGDEVGVNLGEPGLACDAVAFETLLDAGRAAEALVLYQGNFLEGFHVPEVAAEYEEWVERTRARLRTRAAEGARQAAGEAERAGDRPEAVRWARRACVLAPDEESGWRELIALLDRLGDRAGALRAYDDLALRLTREFSADPAEETVRLAESIRARPAAVDSVPVAPAPVLERSGELSRPTRRWRTPALALMAVCVLAGYIGLREAGPEPEPSLVQSGVLELRDRLLVADFADLADDPLLASAVTEALRVDLAESRLVRVLSSRQIRGALTRMERSPDLVLDDSLAREIAVREGVKAFVTGSVAKLPGTYTLSLQLLAARSGDLLVGLRETAADSNDLLGAVDRLSERLRARIGESLRDLRAELPLSQVTTASLAALRHYSEGQRLLVAGHRTEGIKQLERAVALDTGFASAWRSLGITYGAINETGRMVVALEHALANQARLPFYERYHTVASYAANVSVDPDRATDAYQRVLERYPDDVRALNNLGHVMTFRRRFAEAEDLFSRALALDSTIPVVQVSLAETRLLRGDFDGARRELDAVAGRFPGHHGVRLLEIYLAAARQDWELAERHAETRLAATPADTLDALDGYETLAGITMLQGRLREAERHSLEVLRLSRQLGSASRHLSSSLRLGYLELRHRGSVARGLEWVERGLAAFPLDRIPEGDRPYDELSRFFAAAGRVDRSRKLLDEASRTVLGRRRLQDADRLWTMGRIAYKEKRYPEATAALLQAAETYWCTICVLPDLGRSYEAAGNADAAVVAYERYLATPWKHRFESDALEVGWIMRRLGELYQRRGEAAKARDIYARLIRLWRRADEQLQPVVTDVRQRFAAVER